MVRVVTGRPPLLGVEGRHPQVGSGEAGPAPDTRARVGRTYMRHRLMRRSFSWSSPKVPAGHGSIWTRPRSSIPRRRIASCQRRSACRASMTPMHSSISSAGRAGPTVRNERKEPWLTETTASATSADGPGTSTSRTLRGRPGQRRFGCPGRDLSLSARRGAAPAAGDGGRHRGRSRPNPPRPAGPGPRLPTGATSRAPAAMAAAQPSTAVRRARAARARPRHRQPAAPAPTAAGGHGP